jgi:uncharacterized protein
MNVAEELQKLQRLRESGAISEEEFALAKAKLLATPATGMNGLFGSTLGGGQQTRLWAMFLHFSQFAGYIIPLGGFIVPIVIWQTLKSRLPGIDEHGKIVCNWIISAFLYWVVCILLFFLVVGFPFALVLGVLSVIFPIIGGIKANNGEAWRYPLSIPFFR